jgi:signal transduction histidine kinase
VHPDDKPQAMAEWMRCVENGANYEAEYRLRSRDGYYRWFRARAIPIRDDSRIVRWYGTCSDIHDSKLLEQSIRDNATQLEKTVDRRTNELRRLSTRLLTAQDEERRRLARDLHDGLGQELAVAKMVLDRMRFDTSTPPKPEAWLEASGLLDNAIQQVRTLSHLLHPPLLDEVGLRSALAWYLEGLAKRSGIETTFSVEPADFPRLPSEVETATFRIVQEALTNVFRHSEARKVSITLTQTEEKMMVVVQDDGKGIDDEVAAQQPESVGVGIGGMKQRVREFGGELRLTNTHPGTLVQLTIPAGSLQPPPSAVLNRCG